MYAQPVYSQPSYGYVQPQATIVYSQSYYGGNRGYVERRDYRDYHGEHRDYRGEHRDYRDYRGEHRDHERHDR